MMMLKVGKSLSDGDVLWRYMSLDKFINLLDSKTLFFTPISFYSQTDPFEGYMPKVAMDAMADITRRGVEQGLSAVDEIVKCYPVAENDARVQGVRDQWKGLIPAAGKTFSRITRATVINCWYSGGHESEAMWKLYSQSGVAIRTTVGSIKAAFDLGGSDVQTIHMGKVKYVDFNSPDLVPRDCVTEDGHLMGMIKRISYSHENEVRMMFTPDFKLDVSENDLEHEPVPYHIPIDVERLIEGIVMPPFPNISLDKSIQAICRLYNVDDKKVHKSKLLEDCTYLLDAYN
ncbi:DUF2971 domain-containing protein [Chromobacterium violaceum]|nr:DUF2971 domain-containing protein [Chromobacterium violaceum]